MSGYRIARRDFHLPYLKLLEGAEEAGSGGTTASRGPTGAGTGDVFELTEAEAGAALDGLRELASLPSFPLARAAHGAFRKLAFDLDPDAFGETPIVYAEDPETAEARDTLHTLTDAERI